MHLLVFNVLKGFRIIFLVAEFKTIHPSVLYKLLTMTIIHYKKKKKRDVDERKEFLYEVVSNNFCTKFKHLNKSDTLTM